MGGSSTPSRTTTTNEPPAFIQPFLKFGAQEAQNLYKQGGPQFFPESTVVPFSPQTQQALQLTQQRALNGSPVVGAAENYAQRTLNGPVTSQLGNASNPFAMGANPYGGPTGFEGATNPYLDATFDRAADRVQNRLQTSFAGAGRNIGAGRAPAALELNDLANTIYGGAYDADRNRALQAREGERDRMLGFDQLVRGIGATGFENAQDRALDDIQQQRGLQLTAAQLAPGLAQQNYADLAALEGVGGRYEDLAGQYLDDSINRFNFEQQRPEMNLDNYLARITGSFPGGMATQTTPNNRNRTAGALGGAATGASLGSEAGPYGAAIGGILGGLYGAFG